MLETNKKRDPTKSDLKHIAMLTQLSYRYVRTWYKKNYKSNENE